MASMLEVKTEFVFWALKAFKQELLTIREQQPQIAYSSLVDTALRKIHNFEASNKFQPLTGKTSLEMQRAIDGKYKSFIQ